MKPASFEYVQAQSIDETISLLSEHGDEAKVLAGGQSLVPAMNFRLARPGFLIDINGVAGLDHIEASDEGLRVGSLVRHVRLEREQIDGPVGLLFGKAARHVGHMPIRVRGTFGGSLAHADPAAEWCVISSLFDAEIVVRGSGGTRQISSGDFFQTIFTTDLKPDELLVEARFPTLSPTTRVGFTEFSRRAGDFALTMAAVAVDIQDGLVREARVGLGGVSDRPRRATQSEQMLMGQALSTELIDEVGAMAAEEIDTIGDIHGSAEYRKDLIRVLTKRALGQVASA